MSHVLNASSLILEEELLGDETLTTRYVCPNIYCGGEHWEHAYGRFHAKRLGWKLVILTGIGTRAICPTCVKGGKIETEHGKYTV